MMPITAVISVQRNLIEKPQWFLWDVGVICKQYVVNQVRREAAPVLGVGSAPNYSMCF